MKVAFTIILGIVIIIFQSSAVRFLEILGYVPDLRLIFVVYVALRSGSIAGMSAGFWTGFVFDVYSYENLGSSTLAGTVVGYLSGLANIHVIEMDRYSKVFLLSLAFLLHDSIYVLFLQSLQVSFVEYLTEHTLGAGIYTVIIGAMFIFIWEWKDQANESR
jgi:rod shape-determining protein MreD